MSKDKKPKKEIVEKPEKVLGKSSYKNSKQKKKVQKQKLVEVKKVVTKDRQLKVKIKHLEKELERIARANEEGRADKKIVQEKMAIEDKLNKLKKVAQKTIKTPAVKK